MPEEAPYPLGKARIAPDMMNVKGVGEAEGTVAVWRGANRMVESISLRDHIAEFSSTECQIREMFQDIEVADTLLEGYKGQLNAVRSSIENASMQYGVTPLMSR